MVPFNSDRKHKNRKVEPETMDRIYDMVKTQYKTGPVMKYDDYLTDSPSIFKHEGNWYMMYITISKDVSVSGYETHLAKSKDLIDWEQYCTILRRNDRNRWDSKQCAGYAAFVDIEFGKTNEIRKVDDRYYFSYLAGNSDGYEPDPLYMGLAYSVDPTDPSSVTRLEEPILRPDDVD
ncbi:MAG TPA: glycosylase, partial [Clostridia bacterium]|nr:glycosylase [Clostridia bacterium]